MPKFLVRIVALLLVPCLVVDPVTASIFFVSQAALGSRAEINRALFNQEALAASPVESGPAIEGKTEYCRLHKSALVRRKKSESGQIRLVLQLCLTIALAGPIGAGSAWYLLSHFWHPKKVRAPVAVVAPAARIEPPITVIIAPKLSAPMLPHPAVPW